jgi:demethylmenaquinone methyltransferase/2-methoxy-6-polyprenyl-1,4-benzoquinol methylase
MSDKTTHFGFQQVPIEDKAQRVRGVFDSVATDYDLMNDVMSLGIHRLWKRIAIGMANFQPGQRVLDLAGGTGDLARLIATKVGPQGRVILSDINNAMIMTGRTRLLDQGIAGNMDYVQADAEKLPFPGNCFDCITMGFGLRNVTHKQTALESMYRVLKPAGRLLILEFSRPLAMLRPAYDFYSFSVLPLLGRFIANDAASYRYLAESIRMHPDQQTLLGMLESAGFEDCDYHNLTCGIVAIHRGYKY